MSLSRSTSTSLRAVAGGAALILGVLGMTACSASSGSSSGTTTLKMAMADVTDAPSRPVMKKLISSFEAENPKIDVVLQPASSSYESDMKVQMAAGNLPDIFSTHGWSLQRYSKALVDLKDQSWASKVNPQLDPVMRGEGGSIYALPMETQISGILVNLTVMEKAGVDPNSISSWSDFTKACTKVKAAGFTAITLGGKDQTFTGVLSDWMIPGYSTDEQLQKQQNGSFQTKPVTEALDQIQQWKKDNFFSPDYVSASSTDMINDMANDRAGFAFGLAGQVEVVNPNVKLAVIAMPSSVRGAYALGGESNAAYGITKASKNIPQAEKFLDFLSSDSSVAAIAEADGQPSGLTGVDVNLGGLGSSYDRLTADKVKVEPVWDRVYLPSGMWANLISATDSVLTGQGTPDQAVSQFKQQFQATKSGSN